ncbi:uncharacterized protein LOC119692624 [Plutella xylostella]|uniref:uncharacterized protein LOC119692624 n=1 Tax=Plutella xylostella TaxID=51655 RepID=UPI00203299B4|nr:uncharacterized protein LOC119692624 [Plutella xylostella]XP_048485482.1 uncharacterized protein LOC119692624 [Plutella xylostella]XP_048485483.1 uncharacterized protein LOC119692624 [Plutella xylostella]XP_048485484.1 uncharacterized protein LOC119692624 [Plutella xylostella]
MGCGSSSQVIPTQEAAANGHKGANGNGTGGGGKPDDDMDDLPTEVLPDTPAVTNKAPIAFEIPLEELDGSRRPPASPPPHLQRLMQPPQPDVTLPAIEEKLAEAELRRQTILQQRAASAQRRAQKMMARPHPMDQLDSDHEGRVQLDDISKHPGVVMPPEPPAPEQKNI